MLLRPEKSPKALLCSGFASGFVLDDTMEVIEYISVCEHTNLENLVAKKVWLVRNCCLVAFELSCTGVPCREIPAQIVSLCEVADVSGRLGIIIHLGTRK